MRATRRVGANATARLPLLIAAAIGAAVPGDTNGQGSGGGWLVVDPAGGLIKDAG